MPQLPPNRQLKKISEIVEKTDNTNPVELGDAIFDYIDISSIDNKNYTIIETKKIQ
jgi:type I restriction enzyme, S subunit